MNKDKIKVFFFIAGALDLVSLYRYWHALAFHIHNLQFNFSGFLGTLGSLLVISFVFSAGLLILNKKAGLILYYFQFPMRLGFAMLSFGFLFSLMPNNAHNGLIHNIYFGIIVGLEMLRLVLTILVHRRG